MITVIVLSPGITGHSVRLLPSGVSLISAGDAPCQPASARAPFLSGLPVCTTR